MYVHASNTWKWYLQLLGKPMEEGALQDVMMFLQIANILVPIRYLIILHCRMLLGSFWKTCNANRSVVVHACFRAAVNTDQIHINLLQKRFGKCDKNWMVAGKFCSCTCGRCGEYALKMHAVEFCVGTRPLEFEISNLPVTK